MTFEFGALKELGLRYREKRRGRCLSARFRILPRMRGIRSQNPEGGSLGPPCQTLRWHVR
jgi:hypothetical protein